MIEASDSEGEDDSDVEEEGIGVGDGESDRDGEGDSKGDSRKEGMEWEMERVIVGKRKWSGRWREWQWGRGYSFIQKENDF